ncbi:MAG: hypothetical protein J6X44_07000 [Thermoguttaceae bacterium]|nr:hypothetical protein [Thermoguttaceae bacterium]
MNRVRLLQLSAILLAFGFFSCSVSRWETRAMEPQKDKVVNVPGDSVFDYGTEPIRYLENDRVKLGLNMELGGAVTYLEDKANKSGNMINSCDWGRQIQLSYYSGPHPFIGPNGEKPSETWAGLGWNPIQSGDCGGYRSQVLSFEQVDDKVYLLRARPMLWPHSGVPAECVFECRYELIDNGFILDATIINNRSDKTFYDAHFQETPALYTNAPWYKLVSYLGDKPFENEPITTIIDKNDQKGWPWTNYYTPEHWSALVNDANCGVGVYQPYSTFTTAGFHGGDEAKGQDLGEKSGPTGYIAPLEKTILDWNIKRTYRAIFIVGSVDEIRSTIYRFAQNDVPKRPNWVFEKDRQNWGYVNATDQGYPIENMLKINLSSDRQAIAQSPLSFWKAEDAPILEIDAEFIPANENGTIDDEITIQLSPVSPSDFLDATERSRRTEARKTDPSIPEYPTLPRVSKTAPVKFDAKKRIIRVNLSDQEGYSGAMKNLEIVFPQRNGNANVYSVRFLEK